MRKGMMVGKGKKGYHNVIPTDKRVHSMSSKGIKQPQRASPIMRVKELTPRQEMNIKYENYIINSISSDNYDEDPKTSKEKLQFLKDRFINEYWNNNPQAQRLGEQNAFKEWIQGLPSSFNIEFTNYDILKLAKEMGSLPQNATDKQEDRVLENYWNFMANKTFQAFKKYNIR